MKETIKTKIQDKTVNAIRSNIAWNIITAAVVMLLVFGLVAQVVGYLNFSDAFTDEYSQNAIRIARAAGDYVFADRLDDYLKEDPTQIDYILSYSQMENLCNKVGAEFIYVIQPSEDYSEITFVFNTVNKASEFEPYPIGYVRKTTNDDYKEKYRRLYDQESLEEIVVRDKGFIESGSHITAMIALYDDSGKTAGILCVQRQMDALSAARRNYLIHMAIILVISLVLVATFYGLYLRRYMVKPLRAVKDETERFAAAPSKAQVTLSETVKTHNEIRQLAAAIDTMEEETLNYIENLTAVTAEQERIGVELGVASAIQQGMLNSVSPNRPELDISAIMDPAKEVGGDFFDYFLIDDDHLCMTIADVSGKGVPASLFMAITKVLITDTTLVTRSPAEILRMVNERVCQKNKLDMFVTVWLGILEISTGRVIAANAGHEYPLIYHNGGAFELMKDKHGFVIGGMEGVRFREYEFVMKEGDSLFLYTDGVPEATDSSEQLFGLDRTLAALNTAPDGEPQALMASVREAVDKFVGDAPQFDDLTMMCLKYYGASGKERKEEE